MENFHLTAVVREIIPEVTGRSVARVSLSATTLLIDLRLSRGRRLLASLDPASPAFYLSTHFAGASRTPAPFLLILRKHLFEARLINIKKPPLDRIVQLDFERSDDEKAQTSLVLELTGRSANAYLLDSQGKSIGSLFERGAAEPTALSSMSFDTLNVRSLTGGLTETITRAEVLDRYFGAGSVFGPQVRNEFEARCNNVSPAKAFRSLLEDLFNRDPVPLLYSRFPLEEIDRRVINLKTDLLLSHIELAGASGLERHSFSSLSEAADLYYSLRSGALALNADWTRLKQALAREINRRESAMNAIRSDRARFENPGRLKQYGDLLLANLANARIEGSRAAVVDYYDSDQTEIQIDIPEKATLEQAASDYYARYRKARRAMDAIASREREVSRILEPLKHLLRRLEQEPTFDCIEEVRRATERLLGTTKGIRPVAPRRAGQKEDNVSGRRFRSSDGYEIIVGRNDRDNDVLTFRVARSADFWLHAADYPGSHVVIRNPTRQPVPHRTITEAAELAAFYSQAKREGKAAVHYTQKKFVSKPPRSRPGLVRLSSFKTILVAPCCNLERVS